MPYKDLHAAPFDEGTQTKLDVFENYLQEWLPVFLKTDWVKTIQIYDFFAGTGEDQTGCPGSPLRILKIINQYIDLLIQSRKRVKIILNEYDPDKFDKVKTCVNDKEIVKDNNENLFVEFYNKDFQVIFYEKLSKISETPSLLFIDQNGIKQVTNKIFAELLNLKQTDFLFFISSYYFKRFSNEPGFIQHFPDLSREKVKAAKPSEIHEIVLDYYKNLIPEDNQTRIYPFTLKKNRNVYGLIFGSKHPLGVEKFLKVAWKKNTSNGAKIAP